MTIWDLLYCIIRGFFNCLLWGSAVFFALLLLGMIIAAVVGWVQGMKGY